MKLSRKRVNNVVALPREPSRRDRGELAFLPAALEKLLPHDHPGVECEQAV